MQSIPGLSQVKSLVQWAGNDKEGAIKTQDQFSKKCPIVSQARSGYHWANDQTQEAKDVQKDFVNNLEGFLDGTPVVGHVKGGYHYATGNSQKGANCMKAASRTTGAVAGGIAGGLLGGPPGAIAGGVAGGLTTDGLTTLIQSKVYKEYRPAGYFGKIQQINKKQEANQNSVGDVFDIVLMPVTDGLSGYAGGQLAQEVFVDVNTKKLYKVVTKDDVKYELEHGEVNPETHPEVTHSPRATQNGHLPEETLKGEVNVEKGAEQKVQAPQNKKNLFTKEPIESTKENNVNVKGPESLAKRNDEIIGLEEVDPNAVKKNGKWGKVAQKYGNCIDHDDKVKGKQMSPLQKKKSQEAE